MVKIWADINLFAKIFDLRPTIGVLVLGPEVELFEIKVCSYISVLRSNFGTVRSNQLSDPLTKRIFFGNGK